jgi:hypothetical protein
MNGLEPYDRRDPPLIPLSGGARFVRGFGRIGLVLAILFGIGGIIVTYFIAQEETDRAIHRVWQRQCIRSKFQHGDKLPRLSYRQDDVDMWDAGCSGPETSIPFNALVTLQPEPSPDYYSVFISKFASGAIITVCVAAIPLVFFLIIGWIAAGFTRF